MGPSNLTAGEIYFTPALGICNPQKGEFDYTVSDGNGGTDTGHVTIDLLCNGTNHDPNATNDERSGTETPRFPSRARASSPTTRTPTATR